MRQITEVHIKQMNYEGDLQKAYKVERKRSPNLIVQQELKMGR